MKTIKPTLNHTTLIHLLTGKLSFNLARIKCLSSIILALIEGRCVNLARIAGFYNTQANLTSVYRRLQRFMKEVTFPPSQLASILLQIMHIDHKNTKLTLILDRTNWKFGKKDCNILYLAAAYKGIAIPLFGLLCKIRKGATLITTIESL